MDSKIDTSILEEKIGSPHQISCCHEVETLGCGPEATESLQKWTECTKNPGHPNFIPAPRFCLEHLPRPFQTQEYLEIVKALCMLTVRIRVAKITTSREECQVGGPQIGSGRIVDIYLSESPCRCHGCLIEDINNKQCWNLDVVTALHVVDNTEEAKLTKIDLFYDDVDSFANGTAETVWATEVVYRDSHADTCLLRCAIHDQALAKGIFLFFFYQDLLYVIPKDIDSNVVVAVSHPHGRPKQVTVGEITQQIVTSNKSNSNQPAILSMVASTKIHYPCQSVNVIYNADTCPGSSGAPVLWLGYSTSLLENRKARTSLKYWFLVMFVSVLVG